MRCRLFTILSAISVLLGAATAVLWAKSYSLGDSFGWARFSAEKRLFDSYGVDSLNGCISFGGFEMRYDANAETYGDAGPFWYGNMSTLGHRGWFTAHSFWNGVGFDVYDQVTVGRGGAWMDWGIVVPDWLLLLLLAIAPAASLRRRLALRQSRRRITMGLCVGCGYDLRGTPVRCPECGAAPAKSPSASTQAPAVST
jgi:hypothetical protein